MSPTPTPYPDLTDEDLDVTIPSGMAIAISETNVASMVAGINAAQRNTESGVRRRSAAVDALLGEDDDVV